MQKSSGNRNRLRGRSWSNVKNVRNNATKICLERFFRVGIYPPLLSPAIHVLFDISDGFCIGALPSSRDHTHDGERGNLFVERMLRTPPTKPEDTATFKKVPFRKQLFKTFGHIRVHQRRAHLCRWLCRDRFLGSERLAG